MNPNDAMTSATCKKNFFKANKQGASKFLILKGKASSKVVRVSPPLTQKSAFLPPLFCSKNVEFGIFIKFLGHFAQKVHSPADNKCKTLGVVVFQMRGLAFFMNFPMSFCTKKTPVSVFSLWGAQSNLCSLSHSSTSLWNLVCHAPHCCKPPHFICPLISH